MRWEPTDWEGWLGEEIAGGEGPEPLRALAEVLLKIPGSLRGVLADLDGRTCARLPLVEGEFRCVVRVDSQRSEREAARRFDVAVLAEPVEAQPVDLDRLLERVHDVLIEGGILVGLFAAIPEPRGPLTLLGVAGESASRGDRVHEVELHYRLHRAGFQGVRLRRFRSAEPGGEAILAMAVRRSAN